ncbi:ATP-dependent exoDNAse (exonuclease V) alpha subunit [Pseudomonas putida]|nr:ATP-dependent exoDNAse (exonuclease V) alpha subunit [Pseudomonas putida]
MHAEHLLALAPQHDSGDLLQLLDRWVERGWLRALDRAFVSFLEERAPGSDPLLLLAAALASHQLGHGHVCLDLQQTLAEPDFALSLPPEGDALTGPLLLPSQLLADLDLKDWRQRIAASALVAAGDTPGQQARPLVLSGERLYLRRYWRYERRIDQILRQRLTQAEAPLADLSGRLSQLFEGERQLARWTGRSLPVRWQPVPVSASSPVAPAQAKPLPWCACWPCCRGRQWSRAGRCASAWPRRPARLLRA